MTTFVADLPLLQAIVDRAASFESVLDERIDEVDARARRTCASWRGAAADEYATAHAQWVAGARDMHEALGALRRIVSTAHSNYSAALSANRAMWP